MTTMTHAATSFERVLVPTDFSDASERALEYAKAIAKKFGSRLFLVHVTQPISSTASTDVPWIDEEGIQERLEERLEQAGAELRSEGYWAEGLSVIGGVQTEILTFIHENKVDLIVMGAHGRSGFERFFLGSDSEAVLRRVKCPVLVVGPSARELTSAVWRPRNVFCATTFDPNSAWIAAYAYHLAQQNHAEFTLLNVEHPAKTSLNYSWETFERAIKDALPADVPFNMSFHTFVSENPPGKEIAEVAEYHHADLIVMGAHAAPVTATHLFRGTVPRVIADAHCPVMTLQQ
jgi:nucleotide-binding universal stress UspA family protein